ncbi:hypothetical protein LLEC1_01523 [Akanthomyces lecanii]|uniref:HTH CENPB-type domain-containing protein n=1 Tax=Cordyceps confragosa TaxID=2714763 RepID=A0A179I7M5_CORDF|nr:hypothetical protein LLEC1_01523 [Akanthomyces lecanii]
MKSETSQTDELSGNEAMTTPSHYTQGPWHSTSPYSQSPYGNSPLNEYAHFQQYMHHGMPTEPLSGLQAPLSHPQIAHAGHMTHQHLPMLTTTTTWPSELTAHAPSAGYSISSNTLAPAPGAAMCGVKPPEKTRKTLTFEQKRDMCLHHESNPKMRQADIGEIFRVERSTVSKVLRNKEMYLKGEVEKDSSGKRTNGRNPDFERTLGNYIRKQREHGLPMSDAEIMERARQYARGSPNHQAILVRLTPSWLNKFKLKCSIDTAGGALRRASEPSIPEKLSFSARFPDISPTSPSAQTSPLSVSPSDDDLRSRGNHDFTYRQYASQSETSLTNNAASSFSSELISPVGPLGYSPDGHSSGFPLDPEFEAEQKRNGSFHSMDMEYAGQMHGEAIDSTLMTPRNAPSACKQESPAADAMASIPSMRLCRNKLNPGVRISSATPSPEDAQRAAATLLDYLQNLGHCGQFEHEYSTIMKLTMKLDTHPSHFSYPEARGLARIAEGDGELIAAGGGDE